jgi:folylpolyglutamate synthase/dihydropteroate synthase
MLDALAQHRSKQAAPGAVERSRRPTSGDDGRARGSPPETAAVQAPQDAGAPEERVLVCAVLADKDVSHMVALLSGFFPHVIVTAPVSHRAMPVEELAERFWSNGCKRVEIVPDAKDAVNRAVAQMPEKGMVVVCGSLYLIGEVRALFAESLQIPEFRKEL